MSKNNKPDNWSKRFDEEFNSCIDERAKLGDKLLCTVHSHHRAIKKFIKKEKKRVKSEVLKALLLVNDLGLLKREIRLELKKGKNEKR